MSHAVGDAVWIATALVDYHGETKMHVSPVTVAGIFDGTLMLKWSHGTVHSNGDDAVYGSESEAWEAVVRKLIAGRDRVQAAIDEATAKAAGSRVGEAVPA